MRLSSVEARLYHIPLPRVLTDSTHGEMRHFAVVTVQVRADDGAEGVGYTYTVGKTGGSAVLALIRSDTPRRRSPLDGPHLERHVVASPLRGPLP
jgi:L-alanine-DL-glutamate epimerase-like enolase superfamily enzyme